MVQMQMMAYIVGAVWLVAGLVMMITQGEL